MFVILYYDVNQKRCQKMLKKCRQYLIWVQNSVFEGEITEANYAALIGALNKIIKDEDGDSVIVYKFRSTKYSTREVYGFDKKQEITFI